MRLYRGRRQTCSISKQAGKLPRCGRARASSRGECGDSHRGGDPGVGAHVLRWNPRAAASEACHGSAVASASDARRPAGGATDRPGSASPVPRSRDSVCSRAASRIGAHPIPIPVPQIPLPEVPRPLLPSVEVAHLAAAPPPPPRRCGPIILRRWLCARRPQAVWQPTAHRPLFGRAALSRSRWKLRNTRGRQAS